MSTNNFIDQIDAWLQQHRKDYYSNLLPGATPEMLDAIERQFGVQFPEAFRSFYQWRNGQHRDCYDPLLLNLTFMPLESVAENKQMLDGMIGTEFDNADWWRCEWMPFLENGGGDLLCLDMGGFVTGDVGQLIWFDHEDAERDIIHPDFDEFLIDLLNRMNTGALELA